MRFTILTLFPEMIQALAGHSILGRAQQRGLIAVEAVDIRAYTANKHRQADDYPFGGGAGMVMMPQPVFDAMDAVQTPSCHRIYLTPQGKPLTQQRARELAQCEHLVLLCGHYEGMDQRVVDQLVDEELSIGDYVLTGGELPALVLVDCVSRLVPGVLGSEASSQDESFSEGLLEYPQYTRPADFRGLPVPEVLLSGHHANIQAWRRQKALEKTLANRPDLLVHAPLTPAEQAWLQARQVAEGTGAGEETP